MLLPLSILPTNFALVGGPVRTTPQGCRQVQVGERHPSKHLAVDLRSRHTLLISCSYLATVFFTASMSEKRDTKTVISSAKAKTLALTWPTRRTPIRAGFAFSSLSLWSKGSKAALPNRLLSREEPWALFVHLHYCLGVVVQNCSSHRTLKNADPSAELRFESSGL